MKRIINIFSLAMVLTLIVSMVGMTPTPVRAATLSVNWSDASTGDLNGTSATMTGLTGGILGSADLSGTGYSGAPLSTSTPVVGYTVSDDWTVTFGASVSNLYLYAVSWRGAEGVVDPVTYTFDQPFTILSGFTGATKIGNTLTVPASAFAVSGILQFAGPITSLTVTSNSTGTAQQGLTFGITDPAPSFVTVTKTADTNDGVCDSDCSLREAIAVVSGVDGVIDFDSSLSGGTIRLGSTLILSKDNVMIDGSALASPITISGDTDNNSSGDVKVFHVNSGVTADLNSLIIEWGVATDGAGIYNQGTLTIIDSTFSDHVVSSAGGAIYNAGALTVTRGTFSDNSAGPAGGAILDQTGSMTVIDSTFSDNSATSGGAIYSVGAGSSSVDNSTFSGNTVSSQGSAIYHSTGVMEVTNSTFSANNSTGIGGGTTEGGAIFNASGTLTLTNSTLSGNSSSDSNGAAGVLVVGGTLNYANTIIANSTPGGRLDCKNTASNGIVTANLVESNSGCGTPAYTADPKLGSLADNGGETETIALLSGSPALDKGDNTTCAASLVNNLDQRGVTRPNTTTCDIGAYEAEQLKVTADSKTITYGDSDPTFTFEYSGFTDGDDSSVLTTEPTCGVSGTHTNAGEYDIVCSGGVDEKYLFVYVDGTLTIEKVTPTLSVTNSPVTYNESSRTATVTGSVAGTVSDIKVGGAANQTNAGTYAVTADFVPTDTTNYNSLADASAGDFVIEKATPTVSVTNSPVTYNGSSRTATVTGSVAGTVSDIKVGGAANQTNAGTYAVTADFVPTDTTNYNSLADASAGNFVIEKATPTVSVTNSPVTYNGSPRTATVTGSVDGTVSDIKMGGAANQTNAGTYAVTADFVPTDTTNYNSLADASAGNFVIEKATPTLSVTNSPVMYDGSPHAAVVSSSAPGVVSNVLTGGAATQTEIDIYAVTADFVPSNTTNYNSLTGASAGNFVITNDIVPPDTQIDTAPDEPSMSSVSFAFSSTDGTATFECEMDGGGFSACTSPKNYTGLSDDEHTFKVRAKDLSENLDETPAFYVWTVDGTAPVVSSIVRQDANPTDASSVDFDVTFSETVTGVNTSDFALTTTGVSSASVTSVSGSGSSYTVTVNTGIGNGTIRLDVADNDTIIDSAGNALGGVGAGNGNYTTGEVYDVERYTILQANFSSVGTYDGWILESNETSNTGGTMNASNSLFYLGDDAQNRQYRAILHFDTSSLPDNAVIVDAKLRLSTNEVVSGTNPFLTHDKIVIELNTGAYSTSSNLQLDDFKLPSDRNGAGAVRDNLVNGFYRGRLKGDVLEYFNLNGATQLRLRFKTDDDDDNVADLIEFFTGNASVSADRPRLVIYYYIP